jgi:hypothetical protein
MAEAQEQRRRERGTAGAMAGSWDEDSTSPGAMITARASEEQERRLQD